MPNEWIGPKDHETPDDDEGIAESEVEHGLAEEGQGGFEHKQSEGLND